MMDAGFLSNLVAYSAQIALLVGAGAVGAVVLRMDAAAVRYAYWRVLLGTCLVLPFVQARETPGGNASVSASIFFDGAAAGAPGTVAAPDALRWVPVLLLVLAAGAVLRLAWLGTGLVRLRRLRTAGVPAPEGEYADLQRDLHVRADIRCVESLRQPVTFGLFRPVVLLPAGLGARGSSIARAVVAHELFHVRRRDWIWTLAEETVRAAFWFHPVMWWAVSRVQLAREEAVDELVVLATGQRRAYLQALLAFADEAPPAPAAAFARRRHLYRRMLLISKEAVMSPRRVVIACAVTALIVVGGGWYAARAFPMQDAAASDSGPGPLERRAKPVTPENPIPRRTYSVMPVYPPEAGAIGLTATVPVIATIDEYGRVAEARVWDAAFPTVEANEAGRRAAAALRRAAVDAVRSWQYDAPADGPVTFTATLLFKPGAPSAVEAAPSQPGRDVVMQGVLVAQDPDGAQAVFREIRAAQEPGRAVISATGTARARGAAAPPPPPPPPPASAGAPAGAVGGPVPGSVTTADTIEERLSPAPGRPIRVGGDVRAPTKTKHVNPIYPQEAQDARVQGVVIIEAVVMGDGSVGETRVLRSIPLLDQAALDAVQQWEFTPTLLNGVPTPVIMTVTIAFSLT